MIDLSDLSFLVPIRIDHENRKQNLDYVTKYLKYHFKCQILLCEEDKEQSIFEHPYIDKIIFRYSDKQFFHRTKCLNLLIKEAITPFIAIYDCDVLFEVDNYVNALTRLRKKHLDMVYPYLGSFWNIPRNLINFDNVFDPSTLNLQMCHLLHQTSYGGALFANRAKYIKAGMENERFLAWGYEDNERFQRFRKLGYRISRISGNLYHIDHFRGPNSSPENEYYVTNEKEYNRIKIMNGARLKNYIKTWKWTK